MAITDIQNGILYYQNGREKMRIEPWGEDSLRVRVTYAAQIDEGEDWALLPLSLIHISLPPDLAMLAAGDIASLPAGRAGHSPSTPFMGVILPTAPRSVNPFSKP